MCTCCITCIFTYKCACICTCAYVCRHYVHSGRLASCRVVYRDAWPLASRILRLSEKRVAPLKPGTGTWACAGGPCWVSKTSSLLDQLPGPEPRLLRVTCWTRRRNPCPRVVQPDPPSLFPGEDVSGCSGSFADLLRSLRSLFPAWWHPLGSREDHRELSL